MHLSKLLLENICSQYIKLAAYCNSTFYFSNNTHTNI